MTWRWTQTVNIWQLRNSRKLHLHKAECSKCWCFGIRIYQNRALRNPSDSGHVDNMPPPPIYDTMQPAGKKSKKTKKAPAAAAAWEDDQRNDLNGDASAQADSSDEIEDLEELCCDLRHRKWQWSVISLETRRQLTVQSTQPTTSVLHLEREDGWQVFLLAGSKTSNYLISGQLSLASLRGR